MQTTLFLNVQRAFGRAILEDSAHVFHKFTIVTVNTHGTLKFIKVVLLEKQVMTIFR
jgi:hypothetical protein